MTRTEIPTKDGMYTLDENLYRSVPCLSYSSAKKLLQSPKKFQHSLTHPEKPKRIFDVGHLVHGMILRNGPEIAVLDPKVHGLKKDGTVADSPRATATWKEADAEARERGAVPIHIDDYAAAEAMRDAVYAHPVAGPLFKRGHAEKAFFATDPVTELRYKGRLDWVILDGERLKIVEVKTTTDAHPRAFEIRASKLYYPLQAAFYRDLLKAVNGDPDPTFITVVVETTAPHLVSVVEWDSDSIAQGDRWKRLALDTYARCIETDVWTEWSDVDSGQVQPIRIVNWLNDDPEQEIVI